MSLQRKCIHEGVRQILLDATAAEGRVTTNRADRMLARSDLQPTKPAIAIYTLEEDSDVLNDAPRIYEKTLEVAIEGFLRKAGQIQLDHEADLLVDQIERLILPKMHLGDEHPVEVDTGKSQPTRLEFEFSNTGERLAGAFRLVLSFVYRQHETEESAEFEAYLKSIDTEWQLGVPDDQVEAKDLVTVPHD